MYSNVIDKILFNFPTTRNTYAGTFALDKLPKIVEYPSSMIINNQKSTQPGGHWISIHFDRNKRASFFDSYAQSAKSYNLEIFLKKHSISFTESTKPIQAFSSYCSYYCILFVIFISLGYSLKGFLKFFKSPIKNDKLLKKLIREN